ncbi:hypothetical protein [Chryseobacterium sp.]|uniref:hypothetical protein n=1 Tax=Chryseobacterium sp. TaxID=1871047 RepID=UPI003218E4BA
MLFLKKNYIVILFFFMIGIIAYDYFIRKSFKNNYRETGEYAVGTIHGIKEYGRGTGYYYLYTFKVGNKEYKGRCDGEMPFSKGPQNIDKRFLVLYLKNNIHSNVLYIEIPVHDSIKNNSELEKWVLRHPEVNPKLDAIPGTGFFFENYF